MDSPLPIITADSAALKTAVDFIARRVIERGNTIPILACLILTAGADGLTIYGTDLDLNATLDVTADLDGEPFTAALDAGALRDALGKCKGDARLTYDADAERVTLVAGRARFNLPALMPVADMPYLAEPEEWQASFALPLEQTAADLLALSPAVSKEETRFYLRGVRVEIDAGALCMVATDGHVMAVARRDVPAGAEAIAGAIIPAKAITALAPLLKKQAGTIGLALADNRVAITGPGFRLVAKLIDGTYPVWQNLLARFADPEAMADAPLFPDLLPGAPTAQIERIEKAAKLALDWTPSGDAMLGRCATDPGLTFVAMAMRDDLCAKKGFDYGWEGRHEAQTYLLDLASSRGLPSPAEIEAAANAINETWGESGHNSYGRGAPHESARFNPPWLVTRGSRVVGLTIAGEHTRRSYGMPIWTGDESGRYVAGATEALAGSYSIIMPAEGPGLTAPSYVDGPDGHRYPVADNGSAIHLSKEQLRALVGESCFETIELALGTFICRWLWEQGDSRFLLVAKDGRFKGSGPRQYVTRAEAEILLGVTPPPVEEAVPVPHETSQPEYSPKEAPVMIEAVTQPAAPEPSLAPAPAASNPELPQMYALMEIMGDMQRRLDALEAVKPDLGTEPAPPAVEYAPVPDFMRERRLRMARRYLAMRAQRDLDRRALEAANDFAHEKLAELQAARHSLNTKAVELEAMTYCFEQVAENYRKAKTKRARSTILARQRGRDMVAMAAVAHEQRRRADLETKARETLEFDRVEMVTRMASLELEAREPRALYQAELDRKQARIVFLENREIERLSGGRIKLNFQTVTPATLNTKMLAAG